MFFGPSDLERSFGLVWWHISHCRLFSAKSNLVYTYHHHHHVVLLAQMHFVGSILKRALAFFYTQLNDFNYFYIKSEFSISHLFEHIICFIWPIDRTLSGTTTPSQSGPGSNGNEGVLHVLQISKAGASPSDGLMSYLGHSLEESYPSSEMKSVYSTAPADWAIGVPVRILSMGKIELSVFY